jgi:hypothetical protein
VRAQAGQVHWVCKQTKAHRTKTGGAAAACAAQGRGGLRPRATRKWDRQSQEHGKSRTQATEADGFEVLLDQGGIGRESFAHIHNNMYPTMAQNLYDRCSVFTPMLHKAIVESDPVTALLQPFADFHAPQVGTGQQLCVVYDEGHVHKKREKLPHACVMMSAYENVFSVASVYMGYKKTSDISLSNPDTWLKETVGMKRKAPSAAKQAHIDHCKRARGTKGDWASQKQQRELGVWKDEEEDLKRRGEVLALKEADLKRRGEVLARKGEVLKRRGEVLKRREEAVAHKEERRGEVLARRKEDLKRSRGEVLTLKEGVVATPPTSVAVMRDVPTPPTKRTKTYSMKEVDLAATVVLNYMYEMAQPAPVATAVTSTKACGSVARRYNKILGSLDKLELWQHNCDDIVSCMTWEPIPTYMDFQQARCELISRLYRSFDDGPGASRVSRVRKMCPACKAHATSADAPLCTEHMCQRDGCRKPLIQHMFDTCPDEIDAWKKTEHLKRFGSRFLRTVCPDPECQLPHLAGEDIEVEEETDEAEAEAEGETTEEEAEGETTEEEEVSSSTDRSILNEQLCMNAAAVHCWMHQQEVYSHTPQQQQQQEERRWKAVVGTAKTSRSLLSTKRFNLDDIYVANDNDDACTAIHNAVEVNVFFLTLGSMLETCRMSLENKVTFAWVDVDGTWSGNHALGRSTRDEVKCMFDSSSFAPMSLLAYTMCKRPGNEGGCAEAQSEESRQDVEEWATEGGYTAHAVFLPRGMYDRTETRCVLLVHDDMSATVVHGLVDLLCM